MVLDMMRKGRSLGSGSSCDGCIVAAVMAPSGKTRLTGENVTKLGDHEAEELVLCAGESEPRTLQRQVQLLPGIL